jgi:hypothetical protein
MVGATSAKLVSDCIIQGNDSTEGWIGGVAMLDTTNNTLRNSLIINNDVPGSGGGVYLEQGAIENCTVARNKCSGSGGGIYRNAAGVNSITNTIVYYNSATTSGNDIFNPDNSRFGYCCSPDLTAGSNGNITNAPGFVYAGSGYGLTAELGDYRLTPRSPCVDKGAYLSWMNGATDLVGKKRIFRGVVDMGAFEDDTPCGTVICIR